MRDMINGIEWWNNGVPRTEEGVMRVGFYYIISKRKM